MISYIAGARSPDLVRLQDTLKGILTYIDDVCSQHDIPYFLVAGSALGAVRHADVIPWDDDIDVGLLREDYEKLITILSTSSDDRYHLQNSDTEPKFPLAYSKLRLRGTIYEEPAIKRLRLMDGIFIDLFPFDHLSNPEGIHWLRKAMLYFCDAMLVSATPEICLASRSRLRAAIRLLCYCIRKPLGLGRLRKLQRYLMRSGSNQDCEYACSFALYGISKYEKTIIAKRDLLPPKLMPFGDDLRRVPAKVEKHLAAIFGDFMRFPAEEDRKPQHTEKVSFLD